MLRGDYGDYIDIRIKPKAWSKVSGMESLVDSQMKDASAIAPNGYSAHTDSRRTDNHALPHSSDSP